MRILGPVAAASAAAIALAGCGTDTIDATTLEGRIKTAYERQVDGATVQSVTCPTELERSPGTTGTCRITLADGHSGTVEVRVRDDGKIAWKVTGNPSAPPPSG